MHDLLDPQSVRSHERIELRCAVRNECLEFHLRQHQRRIARLGGLGAVLYRECLVGNRIGTGFLRIDRESEPHTGVSYSAVLFGDVQALQRSGHRIADLEVGQDRW